MTRLIFIYFLLIFGFCPALHAQQRRVQNRPYIDQRRLHYGFLIGIQEQDLEFTNNAHITEDGECWYAEVSEYNPGFEVGVLAELYLTKHLALRIIPTMHFGEKNITFVEETSRQKYMQDLKSTYITCPIDLKYSAERFNNYRPYIMAGVAPIFDLTSKNNQALKTKKGDCMIEVGLGCDFYLPYFKLIPELKFCFGLSNVIDKDRKDLNDKTLLKYTDAVDKISSKMVVLTLYFA